jgi:hypothetical protein
MSCVKSQPWIEHPYALFSLWDWNMDKFSAEEFGETILLLGKMTASSHVMELLGKGDAVSVNDEGKKVFLEVTLPHIERFLGRMGLNNSLAYIARIRLHFKEQTPWTGSEVREMLTQLQERIHDELRSELVLHVPKDRSSLFQEHKLFGDEVHTAFPSAAFDIEEAGKCLALARATACVMHLSRAVEVALRTVATELHLPHRNDWGRHIADIETELAKRYKQAGARTPDELFYSEAVSQIDHIKTAWRNSTMHVDRIYTEEIAHDIFTAIKALLRHLATRLHE